MSWIECTFEDVREAGDHYIVLGRVRDLAVERSTLPLLFFQGGYGKFSPGSFIAAPDPELIQSSHAAETMRIQVEKLSVEVGVNCSVLARIRWDAVQVLAANHAPIVEPFPLGHRQPIIPPFGAVFMVNSSDSDIDEWLGRAPDLSDERRDLNRSLLDRVRECGYSLLAAGSEVLQRHQAALSAFEQSDRLPRQQRVVQQVTLDLADFLFTNLVAGEHYDLANIVVLGAPKEGRPPMALRMTGLPTGASTEQIESWIDTMKQIVA